MGLQQKLNRSRLWNFRMVRNLRDPVGDGAPWLLLGGVTALIPMSVLDGRIDDRWLAVLVLAGALLAAPGLIGIYVGLVLRILRPGWIVSNGSLIVSDGENEVSLSVGLLEGAWLAPGGAQYGRVVVVVRRRDGGEFPAPMIPPRHLGEVQRHVGVAEPDTS